MIGFGDPTKGYVDTKQFRLVVLQLAQQRLGVVNNTLSEGGGTRVSKESGLLFFLDSSYKAEVPSTVYALHLKAIAFESSRFLCTTQQVSDDIIFVSCRGEFLSQNIASFLFPEGNRFSQTDSTDEKVRNFYLSIVEAYFGGSTKSNIERSLFSFLGIPVSVIENFLIARNNFAIDAELKKFTFDVVVQIDDPRIKDVNKLQSDIMFLLNIIKPAHTFYETKFIFSEVTDSFGKGCTLVTDVYGNPIITHDGFETKTKNPGQDTAICDTFHIDTHDYYYEDLRKKSVQKSATYIEGEVVQEEEKPDNNTQASPRIVESLNGGDWQITPRDTFHTKYGPIGKSNGQIATSPTDIKVFVNNVPVSVLEIYPLSSAFKLAITTIESDVVMVNYYYLREYISALTTNDFDSVINNFGNQATEYSYKTVLFPTNYTTQENIVPLEVKYKYKGFFLFNSSVLNNTFTLSFNELGLRNRLNDYDVFKSFGYDNDIYNTTLNENTTLVPISLDSKEVFNRLRFQEIRLNNSEFIMNNREDRLFGEIHYESYHPFYSGLEVSSIDNGGSKGFIHTIFEDASNPLSINYSRRFDDEFQHLGTDYSCQFYTNETFLNETNCVIFGGNAYWVDAYTYHLGGNQGIMQIYLSDLTQETIPEIIENYGWLWSRDPSENSWYRQPHLVGGSITPVEEDLPDIYPIHIDDIKNENYIQHNILNTYPCDPEQPDRPGRRDARHAGGQQQCHIRDERIHERRG